MAVEVDWEAMQAAHEAQAQMQTLDVFAKSGERRLVRYRNGGFQILRYVDEDVPMAPVSEFIPEVPNMGYRAVIMPLIYMNNTMRVTWTSAGRKYFNFSSQQFCGD